MNTSRIILGSLFRWPHLLGEHQIDPAYFTGMEREMYEAIVAVFREEGSVDFLTVKNKLGKKVKFSEVIDLIEEQREYGLTSPLLFPAHLKALREEFASRMIQSTGERLSKPLGLLEASTEVARTVRLIDTVTDTNNENTKYLDDYLMEMKLDEDNNGGFGITTGVPQLDLTTKRFKKGHIWTIGGYTSTGKTWFALHTALAASKEGLVFFYSAEMPARELVGRLHHIIMLKVKDKNIADDTILRLRDRIRIFDSKDSYDSIALHIFSQEKKPDVVFVDFIQNITAPERDEYARLNFISRNFQRLAVKADTCIVLLSQISNESAKSKSSSSFMPFKGSGNIGHTTDVGILLTRNDDEEEDTVIRVGIEMKKNRHGERTDTYYTFNRSNAEIIFPPCNSPNFVPTVVRSTRLHPFGTLAEEECDSTIRLNI